MMSRPIVFTQVRRGANPAHHLPDNYRSPDRSGLRLVEGDNGESVRVDLSGLLFTCYLAPTDKTLESDGATWRVFECPQIDDPKHIERVVRIGDQRETESRPWEHRALVLERDWQRLLAKAEQAKNPKPAVVKPHASEKFFQPRRVQVVAAKGHDYSLNYDRYGVIVLDQAARRVVEMWQRKDHSTALGEWATNFSRDAGGLFSAQEFEHKKDALAIAKQESAKRQLPFDERIDIVEWAQAVAGPKQKCAVCQGEIEGRGYEPVVCADCQTRLDLGERAQAKRVVVDVALEGILRGACLPSTILMGSDRRVEDRDLERALVTELLGLTNATVPARGEDQPNLGEAKFRLASLSSYEHIAHIKTQLTRRQFEHLTATVELVRDLVSAASVEGLRQGVSLLDSLARGRITQDTFDEEVIERAQQMQGREKKRKAS